MRICFLELKRYYTKSEKFKVKSVNGSYKPHSWLTIWVFDRDFCYEDCVTPWASMSEETGNSRVSQCDIRWGLWEDTPSTPELPIYSERYGVRREGVWLHHIRLTLWGTAQRDSISRTQKWRLSDEQKWKSHTICGRSSTSQILWVSYR